MRSAFATFGCSHNSCAGELPRSASSHFVVAIMNGAGSCANNADNHLQPFAIMRTRRAVQKLVTVNILPRTGDGFSAILGDSQQL